jgi:hypothetical protein
MAVLYKMEQMEFIFFGSVAMQIDLSLSAMMSNEHQ